MTVQNVNPDYEIRTISHVNGAAEYSLLADSAQMSFLINSVSWSKAADKHNPLYLKNKQKSLCHQVKLDAWGYFMAFKKAMNREDEE
ncbi:MAG: hypothetical protein O3B41_11715 [Bacteroidetes bacterium]|nr:hypothetical protein [Bacteroidota bacterium]